MTFLVNQAMVDLDIGTAGLVALLGYLVVFFLLLLAVVVLMNTAVAALIRRLRSAGRPGDVPGSVRC